VSSKGQRGCSTRQATQPYELDCGGLVVTVALDVVEGLRKRGAKSQAAVGEMSARDREAHPAGGRVTPPEPVELSNVELRDVLELREQESAEIPTWRDGADGSPAARA